MAATVHSVPRRCLACTRFAQLPYFERLSVGLKFSGLTFLGLLLVAVVTFVAMHYYHKRKYMKLSTSFSALELRVYELRTLESANRRLRHQLVASSERIRSLERELSASASGGRRHRSVAAFAPSLPVLSEIEEMAGESSGMWMNLFFSFSFSITCTVSNQSVLQAATEMLHSRRSSRGRSSGAD